MGRKSSQLSKEGKQANGKIPQQITAELGCVYSLDKGLWQLCSPSDCMSVGRGALWSGFEGSIWGGLLLSEASLRRSHILTL